jgi:hypothetical protein
MTIESQWDSYRLNAMPKDASAVQVSECRRAFVAGAVALDQTLLDIPHDAVDAAYIRVHEELERLVAIEMTGTADTAKEVH